MFRLTYLCKTEAGNLYASFLDNAKCDLKEDNIYNASKAMVFLQQRIFSVEKILLLNPQEKKDYTLPKL